ncbi:MAG: hypothetical protein OEN55_05990 [Alphaproteobacteria bacterium]|nr:hypothetical protein [Alphaproteobacteria bacterium]
MTDQRRDRRIGKDDDRDPRHESRIREWSFTLFLAGAIAFTPPLMMVFDRPAMLFGLPLLYVYLFALWGALIFLAARIASHGRRHPRAPED